MSDQKTRKLTCSAALRSILLIHLQSTKFPVSPGGDGLTIDDALAMYHHAMCMGDVPDEGNLRRLHPTLASDLDAFFGERENG